MSLFCFLLGTGHALDNGLALQPPMGWRSWNAFHGDVSDPLIRSVVDAMAKKRTTPDGSKVSIFDLGYNSVGVDDGWQACGTGQKGSFHDSDGTPLVNRTIFPDLKSLVDYGHKKGLQMGWYDNNCICMDEYTLRANKTFAELSYIGDAKQILDAGFDGVKIDNCGDDDGSGFVARMDYLNKSGKAILVENSNQGHGSGPPRGLPNDPDGWCNFNFFRSGGDIRPSFGILLNELKKTIPFQNLKAPISRPGCWAYPDMLEVGNFGWQSEQDLTLTDEDLELRRAVNELAITESRTHFGAWCVISSPLILGLNILDEERLASVWHIISNREAIAVNQAWAGHPGRQVVEQSEYQVWAKRLPGGAQAVFVMSTSNNASSSQNITVALSDLDLPSSATVDVWDIWAQGPAGTLAGSGSVQVVGLTQHDSIFYRLTPRKHGTVE